MYIEKGKLWGKNDVIRNAAFIFLVCSLLNSCAQNSALLTPDAPPPAEKVEKRGKLPVIEEKPPETPLEKAFIMAKSNRLRKYFTADKDDIRVYSDISIEDKKFTVKYDLMNAQLQTDFHTGKRFQTPFSIEDIDAKEKRTGTLDWDIEPDESGALLSFDDDYFVAWENNFDLFDKYGAKVTFFVTGKPLAFCKRALERGHDVGYHTIRHYNLPKISREDFTKETISEIGAFRNAGVPLRSFAFPYGLSETWMHNVLLKSFKILRGYGVTFHVYNTDSIKKGYIAAKAVDNIVYKNDEKFKAAVTLMLRVVKFIGKDSVLPLCTHTIADSADWGIKPSRLEYLLKTARDLNLQFYRYQDFISSMEK